MNDEERIKERFGKEQPFRVPEGYFDHFASQFISQLPEREARQIKLRPSRWQQWRPWAAAAAFIGVVAVGATLWLGHSEQQPIDTFADTSAQKVEYTLDQAADYAMLDNQEIYAMMAFE